MPKRNRPFITLECSVCHARNYSTSKNPRTTTDRIELKKFCSTDRKVTLHRETK